MKRIALSLLLFCLSPTYAQDIVPAATDKAMANEAEADVLYQQALRALAEGRRLDASRILQRVIDKEPRHAGAWLEIALIQCGLGNGAEAERLFDTVETRFNPGPELLELIAQTREQSCKPWVPSSSMALSFGRGSDQNVNQGASTSTLRLEGSAIELPLLDEFRPRHDDYVVGNLDYLRDLTPNGTTGFVQAQWRRNDHLRQYDSAALFAGVESAYRIGEWGARVTGIGGQVQLGGHAYQRQAQAEVRVLPPLPLPGGVSFAMMGGATINDYLRLTSFDSRTVEARPELAYRNGTLAVNASLGFLDDLGEAARPGGDRHGQLLSLLLQNDLGWHLTGRLAYTRQTWRSDSAYAPELLIPQIRNQDTRVLRASLTYQINARHSILLEARAVQNRETIPIFQYNNRQLQLSWRWQP